MNIDWGVVFLYGGIAFLAINALRLHRMGKQKGDNL